MRKCKNRKKWKFLRIYFGTKTHIYLYRNVIINKTLIIDSDSVYFSAIFLPYSPNIYSSNITVNQGDVDRF